MRVLIILFSFCLVFNCEDKQSKEKRILKTDEKTEAINTSQDQSDTVSDTLEFPVLNDKTAMDFFLEYDKHNKENKVRIYTDFGNIEIFLFSETKFHRANFIYLTKRGYFNETQFYRVINNFIAQGGNSDDRKTARKRKAIGKYLLPTDTKRGFKHDRGVISMPSGEIDNPYKLASPYEFFIVQQQGGSHNLNGDYTIFGKVTKGMDVIDKIVAVETDEVDWPLQNIYIRKVEIIN